jgi:2-polyprenyl-3-methyl-5-hydroxy-6-metoxy-1,4-benzoquinol methylase
MRIKKYIKAGSRVLDFGCGLGFFVEQLAKHKICSFGFDIGSDKIISRNNAQITNKNDLQDYKETGFDTITLWHVLEHMRDQDAILKNLAGRLNENGRLIVAVPNFNSLGQKLFGQKWGWIQQPYVHINLYDKDTLTALLTQHGFVIRSVTTGDTWDQNLYDLLITRLFYRNKSRNVVRKHDTNATGNLFFRANQIVRLVFTPFSYLVSFLRSGSNEGSELLIIAEKDSNAVH